MSRQPNLLFVFADQWRKHAVGYRKEDPVFTPVIDRFAEESLVLDNAISCFPLCSPNRSSMLTGRYPLSTGVTTNCKPGLDVKMNDDERSIGNILKEQGYRTGYIGKWHLDLPERNTHPNPISGATNWDAYIPPGPRRFGFDFWYSYNAFDRHMAPHYWKDTHEKIQVNEWSLKHETDVAIDYIRNRDKEKPFALYVSWNPPHQPFDQVPETFKKLYEHVEIEYRPNVYGEGLAESERHLRNYFAAVTGMDGQFERLLQTLREEGLEDDTIVVLTSDHGELMGAHNWMEHKNIWYEEAICVPFMIRWPQRIRTDRRDFMFNSVDLVPTLLGLMNVEMEDRIQGTDFSAAFRGEPYEELDSAFICHYPGAVLDHEDAKKRGIDINAFGWRGVRTKRHTYVVKRPYGKESFERVLYDNDADPYQLNPVIVRDEDLQMGSDAYRLEAELTKWLDKINDSFFRTKEG